MNLQTSLIAAHDNAAPAWAGRTALVVEDSPLQRSYLVDLLRQIGFGLVLDASDGNEALRVLGRHESPVFLVLTDLAMPGMDGIELTCQLSERGLAQNLIVISARDPRLLEVVETMRSTDTGRGLLGTLAKPVRMEDLTEMLQRAGQPEAQRAAPHGQQPHMEELELAVREQQFVPYFQPKISVQSGHLKGVEALARWRHPSRGLLGPQHFIGALEGTPLMAAFTLSMARQTVRQLAEWQGAGLPALSASINLSADNLAERGFVDSLAALSAEARVSPSSLVWEVTETTVMRQLSTALTNMGRLRLMGFGLAMDDFGIGYSSIHQFSRCPFTELKIDRAFVNGAAHWSNRRAVLNSAIELGQRLGMATVAEGVETEADWLLLRTLRCDMAQGYLLARPMPAEELISWTKQERPRLRALAAMEPK